MLYYLGKGTEFKKEDCKEYKKLDAALRAAAKDESLVVWDETGKVIGSLTDDVPEGALQTNPDGSVNTYDADGNKTGTVDAETLKEMTTVNDDVSELATGDNEQETPQKNAEDDENASNEDKATIHRPNRKTAKMGRIQSRTRRQRSSRRTRSSFRRAK